MKLASRMGRVQPSPTLSITAKANALKAAGVDIISFGAGEPDFPTPQPIVDAAKAALDAGKTTYTAVSGIAELRKAIARDYARRGREVSADEVLVCVGGKHALYNATMAVFEAGDRVIVPAPYWVSYPAQLLLADAEPVEVFCGAETDFKLTAAQLADVLEREQGITGLILCSPSNPTGAVYTAEELAALGEVLAAHPEVIVFFDAMYDRLSYEVDIAPDLVACAPQLAAQTITFNGFSKTFAMTGWRMGFAIGPKAIIAQMSSLQSQSTSNATTFAQWGALHALELDDEVINGMRDTFKRRRDLLVDGLNAIEGVTCPTPQGAFYAFPDFSAHIGGRFADDLALTAFLLEEAHVALVPGSAFGAPGFMRLSYATSEAVITEGLRRIKAALEG